MKFVEQHKALIITFLLTGIVVFCLFSIHITKQTQQMAETFYDIEPEVIEELLKAETLKDTGPETNKALNEDTEFKALMKNFKSVRSNDFEKTTEAINKAAAEADESKQEFSTPDTYTNTNTYALKHSETASYEKLKATLNKHKNDDTSIDEHAKNNSSMSYSLKGRVLVSYNTPRYLCERYGKIVVSISVNSNGEVFDAYINGASNSKDECLIQHAIEYAKNVRFDKADKSDQLGTITFYFKGKN